MENVQKMGEIIALTSVKTLIVRAGKNLHVLYKGLLRDLHRTENDLSHYSNGYDIAQETILFLCKHIGKRLDGTCYTKTGKQTTIKQAAFSVADRYLAKQYTRHADNTISIDERITADREEILSNAQKNDYTTVDRIISKMNLTAVVHGRADLLRNCKNYVRKPHHDLAQTQQHTTQIFGYLSMIKKSISYD